ncbi:hypothetical protein CVT91_03415 [Candidatus Atribacteria bacterium HGW-Atribacteria-1]|nr:MAG: hypothetical protein CVT91_03415 [Candidatus Atribacteria bacterium HGW-Atribacteria-1]
MRKLIVCLVTLGLIFGLVGTAMAGNTDSHSVTVQVDAINEINVAGGDSPAPAIILIISTAIAGSEPTEVTDTSCTLLWTTNQASKKITVVTNQASPTFTLKVLATGVTGGTAAAEVTLSTTAADFVTAVATTTGICTLQYTASATAAQGEGSDAHIITYTITAG